VATARSAGCVGGLAVAFGIGIGILAGGTDSAAAAPTDRGADARGSVSAGPSVAGARSPAARRSSTLSQMRNASAQGQAWQPASAAPRESRRPIPLSERQTRITFLKNTHLGLPPPLIPFVRKVSGEATLTTDSIYDLKNVDQFDWNKLAGIGFSIPADVNSIQVVWRWNVADQTFEIAPFFNVDKARISPMKSEIIPVPVGAKFEFEVDYDGISVSYGDTTVYKPTPADLKTSWLSFRTTPWFGGTSRAPRTLSIMLNLR